MRLPLGLALLLAAIAASPACSGSPARSDASAEDRPSDASVDTAPPPDAALPPVELRLATWNIEQFPKTAATVERVRSVIEAEQLDLVAVQEIVDVASFAELARRLPGYDYALSYDRDAYLQLGLLYRTSRIELRSLTRGFTRESYPFPRDPLVARVRVLDDDAVPRAEIALVAVHLKAGVGADDRRRREQATATLETWMRTLRATQPNIVLLGDFNDVLTDPDAVEVFAPFTDADTYRISTSSPALAGDYSYIPARVLLDHIVLTRGALTAHGDARAELLALDRSDPAYLREVSDHRPVVTTLRVP